LTVFTGGCELEAAEKVCGSDTIQPQRVLDLLTALVDRSLVIHRIRGERSWYRLLETVRDQASKLLVEEEQKALGKRHAEYYLALVEAYHHQAEQAAYAVWGRRFDLELDNLRLAMDCWIGERGADQAMRMSQILHRYWADRGFQGEGRRWLSRSSELEGAAPKNRANGLRILGLLMFEQKDYGPAKAAFVESCLLHEELGDRAEAASIINSLGNIARETGDYEGARVCFERALAVNSELGMPLCQGMNLGNLGHLADDLGDFDEAIAFLDRGLALARSAGADRIVPGFLGAIGACLRKMGELEGAGAALREGLSMAREQGGLYWQPGLLNELGALATEQGEFEDAFVFLANSLALLRESGDRLAGASALEILAKLQFATGNPKLAARLLGAAAGLREAVRAPMAPSEQGPHAKLVDAVRSRLGESGFDSEEGKGRADSFERAISLALQADVEPPAAGAAKAIRLA
jgi:non-specific serine/threonine protein kinase